MICQIFEKWHNFVRYEARMARCDFRAFDVLYLEANPERIDASESVDSVIKTVVHHAHKWNFVFQDAAHPLKPRFTFVCESSPHPGFFGAGDKDCHPIDRQHGTNFGHFESRHLPSETRHPQGGIQRRYLRRRSSFVPG